MEVKETSTVEDVVQYLSSFGVSKETCEVLRGI